MVSLRRLIYLSKAGGLPDEEEVEIAEIFDDSGPGHEGERGEGDPVEALLPVAHTLTRGKIVS